MLSISKAAAPAIDMIGPDIYSNNPEFVLYILIPTPVLTTRFGFLRSVEAMMTPPTYLPPLARERLGFRRLELIG